MLHTIIQIHGTGCEKLAGMRVSESIIRAFSVLV